MNFLANATEVLKRFPGHCKRFQKMWDNFSLKTAFIFFIVYPFEDHNPETNSNLAYNTARKQRSSA